MSLAPEDRYAAARALADDVERWAADEPVSAWHEPITRRAQRWAPRNRTAVSVAAASVMMAVVGLTAVVAVQNVANAALTDANARLARSNQREVEANANLKAANEQVSSRFALAEEAVRMFHTGISEDILLKQKDFGTLRTKLLRGARDFYQKLEGLLAGKADRDSRLSLARTYREVAHLTHEIDSLSDAITVYRRRLAMVEELAREYPSDTEIHSELGWSFSNLGSHLTTQDGGNTEGFAHLERSRGIYEYIAAARPSEREIQGDLARLESYLADYHQSLQHFAPALEASTQACRRWETLVQADPRWERARFGLAVTLDSHGLLLHRLERLDEAIEPFARARRLAEELSREFPTDRNYGHELIRVLNNMARALLEVRRFDEAQALLDQAREVIKTMTDDNPNDLESQVDLIAIEQSTADILSLTDRSEQAIRVLERARAADELLVNLNPNELRHQEELAKILRKQAACYLTVGKLTQARRLHEQAQSIYERMAQTNPTRLVVQRWIADTYCNLGDIEDADHQLGRARGFFEKALAIRQRRVEADPSDELAITDLADSLRRIGTTFHASNQPADAVQYFRRSIATLERLKEPTLVELYDLACCHSLISGAAKQAGSGLSADDGQAEAELAIAGIRRAFKAGFQNLPWIRTGDPDLKPIRSRQDFQLLVMDMSMPVNPFAR
jgi:tetratricopeptide (TPR) repeat protein